MFYVQLTLETAHSPSKKLTGTEDSFSFVKSGVFLLVDDVLSGYLFYLASTTCKDKPPKKVRK